jgi:hypothetical protein
MHGLDMRGNGNGPFSLVSSVSYEFRPSENAGIFDSAVVTGKRI